MGGGLTTWINNKIVQPFLLILRRGAEPKHLAFSSALGFTLGLFPICGVTVFLCGVAIATLGSRLHAPSVMLFNFVATPVELSLVIPFLRLGEAICGGPHFPLSSDALKKVLTGQASTEVFLSIFHVTTGGVQSAAIDVTKRSRPKNRPQNDHILLMGWLFAAPFICIILYLTFLPCYKILVRKFNSASLSPKKSPYNSPDLKLKVTE